MRIKPFSKCENHLILILDARWEPGWFSPRVRTFNPILMAILIISSHWDLHSTENQRRLKTDWRELPNTNKDWRPHLKFVIYLLWALQIWIFFSVYRTKIMILTRLLQIWPWIMKMLNFSFSSLTSLVLQSFISATLSWLQVSWSWPHTNAVLWRETIRIY